MSETKKLSELLVEEEFAKQEWDQAVQAVKIANERVGKAHTKWLAVRREIEATEQASQKPKLFPLTSVWYSVGIVDGIVDKL